MLRSSSALVLAIIALICLPEKVRIACLKASEQDPFTFSQNYFLCGFPVPHASSRLAYLQPRLEVSSLSQCSLGDPGHGLRGSSLRGQLHQPLAGSPYTTYDRPFWPSFILGIDPRCRVSGDPEALQQALAWPLDAFGCFY